MERVIAVNEENREQSIPIVGEPNEGVIEPTKENVEREINLNRENVIIIYTPSLRDHSQLENLNYDSSGHIGFQEEMGALTNTEIERMWNSV